MTDSRSDMWIEAALAEIGKTGIDGVRVEVLAKNPASPKAASTAALKIAEHYSTLFWRRGPAVGLRR